MKDLKEMKKTLRSHKEEIAREFKAETVGIFRSYLREEQKKTSYR